MLDIRSWKVFESLEPTFAADVRMAMLVGLGEVGIVITKTNQVFSIGSGLLLGLKGIAKTTVPRKIFKLSGTGIKGIYSGLDFVIVLTEDGEMYTWGSNDFGQLGLGEEYSNVEVPKLLTVPNDTDKVTEAACGKWHALVLTKSGKVYAWGMTDLKRLHNPPFSKEAWKPRDVFRDDRSETGRSKIISVAYGTWSSFALRSNGEVWAWGFCSLDKIGFYIVRPSLISIAMPITKIACGKSNFLALDHEDNLYIWGTELNRFSNQTAAHFGRVTDMGATWRSSLIVFQTESGLYKWGKCKGQYWDYPTEAKDYGSVDLVFALEQNMCRPVVISAQNLPEAHQQDLTKASRHDVLFKFEDFRRVHAHKSVLTSRSTYFAAMLSEVWNKGISSPVPRTIPMEGVDSDVFLRFVYYLYTERIDYNYQPDDDDDAWLEKMLQLLILADRYNHVDLLCDCETLLMALLTVENAPEVFRVANGLNIQDLERRALELMAPPNYGKVVLSSVSAELLKLIATKLSLMGFFSYSPVSLYVTPSIPMSPI